MKSYELQPTKENLMKTLTEDTISRNKDLALFFQLLDSMNDCCSLSLDGNWGSGKTFFVKQAKMVLDAYNPFTTDCVDEDRVVIKTAFSKHIGEEVQMKPCVSCYYDAWANDNDEDPLLSLVYSIMLVANNDYSFKENDGFVSIGLSLLDAISGRDIKSVVEALKNKTPFDEIAKQKSLEDKIKDFLDSLLAERGERLVVFVDELDRCKPSFAVRLLERIKHYFSNERITFVFSINASELQHTIKRHYGDNFDAYRYLDRFFDLRMSLPKVDLDKYYRSIGFNNSYYTVDIVSDAVIRANHFEMREIAKYIRLMNIAAYDATHDATHDGNRKFDFSFMDGKSRQFCLLYILPVMMGLKIADSDKYTEFIHGKYMQPLIDVSYSLKEGFFEELLNRNESYDDDSSSDIKTVTLEDKLKQLYDAIFVFQYDNTVYSQTVGKYTFTKQTSEMLQKTVSLLSNYTTIDSSADE